MKENEHLIIAIDIGNTTISLGVFKNSILKLKMYIPTNLNYRAIRGQILMLKKRMKSLNSKVRVIIICSVVPKKNALISSEIKKIFKLRPKFCGKDLIVPIKNLYKRPKSVGQDRLVNAFTGLKLYGRPLVIIDFGTAITFDLISKRGEYLGGIIAPGLKLSLDALGQRAALLPKLSLVDRPRHLGLIGRTTKESMYSGLFFGVSSMSEQLIKRLKKKLGKDAKVVVTGGDVKFIRKFIRLHSNVIDEDLTLKGLNLLSQRF